MSKFIFLLTFIFIFQDVPVFASTILSGVTTKRIGSDFFVEMSFSEDVSDKEIKVHYTDQNIEFVVPDATTAGKKTFTSVKDTTVDHFQAIRNNDGVIKFRLSLARPFAAHQ